MCVATKKYVPVPMFFKSPYLWGWVAEEGEEVEVEEVEVGSICSGTAIGSVHLVSESQAVSMTSEAQPKRKRQEWRRLSRWQ